MTTSADISRAFYDQLGAAALAARTTSAWDQQIITQVLHMLQPGQRVLDVGCGYGRIAVPVAVAGYPVVGLDISWSLLNAARQYVDGQGVTVTWLQASMCQMPLRAILVHHQHNGQWHLGKSEVCGLAGDPLQAFGLALAHHGLVVLAIDALCFEECRTSRAGIAFSPDTDWLQHYNQMCYRSASS